MRGCVSGDDTGIRARTKPYVVLSLLHRRAIFCIKLTMPLTGSLKGDTGTRHGLSLVAAADTCYVACDAPDGQSVRLSVSPLSRVSMEVAWHSGCSSLA